MFKLNELQPRKLPKQERSMATVEAILEATAQVLVEVGFDDTTTNRIAEVAGVSIGTLYQYFSSKESVVLSLIDRYCDETLRQLREHASADTPLAEGVRAYVHVLLGGRANNPQLYAVFIDLERRFQMCRQRDVEAEMRSVVRDYLESQRDVIVPTDLDLAAFVLVTMVTEITQKAVLDRPEILTSQSLEDETCAVVLRYLLSPA